MVLVAAHVCVILELVNLSEAEGVPISFSSFTDLNLPLSF